MSIQKYKNIPNSLIYFDFFPFIEQNQDLSAAEFSLKYVGKFPFDVGFIADQLAIYKKAKTKLPFFCRCQCLFTPQAYEQSSSEELAHFKASLINGSNLLDLSGGLGVDDWAFSKTFTQVDSLEIDGELNKIAIANFEKLGVKNINRITGDAYAFIDHTTKKYDAIFLDADRRSGKNKSFKLADSEPNILAIQKNLLSISDTVLLKLSPMIDISALRKELQQIEKVWVVSNYNEVKEILVLLKSNPKPLTIHAVEISNQQSLTYAVLANEIDNQTINFGNTGLYFYEPFLSIIKAELSAHYFNSTGIKQLAKNSIYGVSGALVNEFQGRAFQVIAQIEFSKSSIKNYLQQHQINKANIAKRNFPMEVDAIKKAFNLKDGGNEYFFFTTDEQKQKWVFHCQKILTKK